MPDFSIGESRPSESGDLRCIPDGAPNRGALVTPLVRGGQGRSDESVEGDAKVVLVWLVLAAAVSIALVVTSYCWRAQ